MTIPLYLPYYVLTGSIAIIFSIIFGLRAALANAGWPEQDRVAVVRTAAVVLVGWFVLTIALGASGAFHATADQLPAIQYGILVPILIGASLIWRSPFVRRIIDAVPQPWIVGVQLYRALGVIFLILYAGGKLPGLFAWPAGIGDILIGGLAPLIGLAYARRPRETRGLVAAWNVFGILDLVIAVATGFLTAPSLLQPFGGTPPNELIDVFPLVLVPVFLVPVSILLHLASLTKLRRETVPVRGAGQTYRRPGVSASVRSAGPAPSAAWALRRAGPQAAAWRSYRRPRPRPAARSAPDPDTARRTACWCGYRPQHKRAWPCRRRR